jgi:PHD/YefM family antitoxin component YafN of YafNO toxin-antitoxin module
MKPISEMRQEVIEQGIIIENSVDNLLVSFFEIPSDKKRKFQENLLSNSLDRKFGIIKNILNSENKKGFEKLCTNAKRHRENVNKFKHQFLAPLNRNNEEVVAILASEFEKIKLPEEFEKIYTENCELHKKIMEDLRKVRQKLINPSYIN